MSSASTVINRIGLGVPRVWALLAVTVIMGGCSTGSPARSTITPGRTQIERVTTPGVVWEITITPPPRVYVPADATDVGGER